MKKNSETKIDIEEEKVDKKSSNKFTNIDGSIRWRKLIFRTVIAIAVVMILLIAYQHFFGGQTINIDGKNESLAQTAYNKLGTSGVFLFVLIVDTFIVPMTVDVMYPLVIAWAPIKIFLVLGTASFIGGILGYWIGRLLSHVKIIDKFVDRLVGTHKAFIDDYGAWAIVLAAISPLPYSTICWAAGVVKVDNRKIILACLARYLRMILYYYIFVGGVSLFG